jgi:hypothetical protein
MLWPFKPRKPASPCFSVGQYNIDATIDGLLGLKLLSRDECSALNLEMTFEGQQLWHCPEVRFMDLQWNTILGTVNRAIFKISIQWEGFRHEAGEACRDIAIYCTKHYGKQKDISFQGRDLTVWDASNGNIVFDMVNMGSESLLNVTLTSRKVPLFRRI